MSPVVWHMAMFDMTDDSDKFRDEDQLREMGVWKRTPPPCFNCGDHEHVANWRPVDDAVPLHLGWMWVGHGMMHVEYRTEGVLCLCGICHELLRIALGAHCGYCGEGSGAVCRDCSDEQIASIFGDYPPETDDCGCAWHNVYSERQFCEERQAPQGPFPSRQYRDNEPRALAGLAGRLL